MNGTSSFTSAGVTIRTSSIPQAFADDIRRCSSSIRSSVRATSMPPLSVKTPRFAVLAHGVERQLRHLLRVVDREDEVRRVAGRAARVRQRALVEQDEVGPAELGEMADEAVADDAGADHDRARGRGPAWRSQSWRLIYHLSRSTSRIACFEVLDVGAHQGGRPFALAASDRLEERVVLEHRLPAGRAPGRARAPRCAARGCSTARASPRAAGCGSTGRSRGGSARPARSAPGVPPPLHDELVQELVELVQVWPRRALSGEPRGLGLEHRRAPRRAARDRERRRW